MNFSEMVDAVETQIHQMRFHRDYPNAWNQQGEWYDAEKQPGRFAAQVVNERHGLASGEITANDLK